MTITMPVAELENTGKKKDFLLDQVILFGIMKAKLKDNCLIY